MGEIKVKNPEEVVAQAFYLAWKACGGPAGLGFLQDKPQASKEDVMSNIRCNGDYPGDKINSSGKLFADYVFGRMLKTLLEYTEDSVIFSDSKPHPEYQGWARTFSSFEELVKTAVSLVEGGVE